MFRREPLARERPAAAREERRGRRSTARGERLGQGQEGKTGVRLHRVRLRRQPVVRPVPRVQGVGLHEGHARRLRARLRILGEELGRRRGRARGGEDRRGCRHRGGILHRHRS